MVNSSLVETIQLLKPQEIADMHLWLESPLHNRGPHRAEIIKLFALLADLHPEFPPEHLTRERIYRLIFGDEVPVKGKLDKAMSELLQQIREFVVMQHNYMGEHRFEHWLNWTAWLRERGKGDRFKLAIAKAEKWQQDNPSSDSEFYHRQFLLEQEKHEWQNASNHKKGDVNLANVIRNLDISYHLNRLEFLNRLHLQQKVTVLELPAELDPRSIHYEIPNSYLAESPILYAEYTVFQLLKYKVPPEAEILALTHWLREHESQMTFEHLNRFWAYLRGLYTLAHNTGRTDIIPILHQIHQENLEKGYLFFEGKLSPSAYKNVTFIALLAEKSDWAIEFVEKYKDLVIGENETRDFYRFNLARCLFAQGKYEQALDSLPPSSSYSDYHSAARRLELQCYYEMDSNLLPFKMDSYRVYVYRATKNVLSEEKKEMLLNFANLLQQICQSPRGDKERAEQILRRIEKKKKVAEKSWLISKAKEISSK